MQGDLCESRAGQGVPIVLLVGVQGWQNNLQRRYEPNAAGLRQTNHHVQQYDPFNDDHDDDHHDDTFDVLARRHVSLRSRWAVL
jgi:hypothetical protein